MKLLALFVVLAIAVCANAGVLIPNNGWNNGWQSNGWNNGWNGGIGLNSGWNNGWNQRNIGWNSGWNGGLSQPIIIVRDIPQAGWNQW